MIGWAPGYSRQVTDYDSGSVAGAAGWYALVSNGSVAALSPAVQRPAPCRGALATVFCRLNAGGPVSVSHALTRNGTEVGSVTESVTSTSWTRFDFDLNATGFVEHDELALYFSGTTAGDRLLTRAVWLYCLTA